MAPHSGTLAWKIPWMEEPGRLQSMGSLRVRHNWAISLSLFTVMHWRRKWQPTPVFLPGESRGRGSLVGCRLWGRTESDTTEGTWQQQQQPWNQKIIHPSIIIWENTDHVKDRTAMCVWGLNCCVIICDRMDYSLYGSSVHGIFQARILEWVAISYSRGSSWPRDQTHVSRIGKRILYHWVTWEAK